MNVEVCQLHSCLFCYSRFRLSFFTFTYFSRFFESLSNQKYLVILQRMPSFFSRSKHVPLIRVVKASLWNGPRRSGMGLDPVRWEEQAIYFVLIIYAIFEKEDKFFVFILFIWLCWVLVETHLVDPHCGMWDLVPWPGIELAPLALEVQSLSHWSIREVPKDMLSTRLELKRILPFADCIFLPCEASQLHQYAGEMNQEETIGPRAIVSDTYPCSAWMQYSSRTVTPLHECRSVPTSLVFVLLF